MAFKLRVTRDLQTAEGTDYCILLHGSGRQLIGTWSGRTPF